jgi:hypothetical protein
VSRSVPQFERFVSRAHRRYVLLRGLERTGLGVLAGSLAALPLLGILLWRGGDALQVAMVALAGGAIAGMVWGLLKRPSRLETALEADRQLGWADLLGSALLMRKRAGNDPFAAAVMAAADARCRQAAPSALVFNRLGARTWGGIGLASALVLVLGLFPTFAAPTQADQQNASGRNALALVQPNEPPASTTARGFSRRTAREQDPDDPNASRMQGAEAEPPASQTDSTKVAPGEAPRTSNESADSTSHGTGASQSKSAQPGRLNPAVSGSDPQASTQSGKNAMGGVGRVANGTPNGTPSGQVAGASSESSHQAPPWRSASWGAKSQQALDAVDAGRIPDAYRDVMRAYFDRP